MELENRYLVLKWSDLEDCFPGGGQFGMTPNTTIQILKEICDEVAAHRQDMGKNPDKKYVVVSEDWPMYQETVDKVLAYAAQQPEGSTDD